jgi:hypothetical protein
MTTHLLPVRLYPQTHDELHPLVYRAIVGLTVWLVCCLCGCCSVAVNMRA